jgi:hypothetical protein
VVGRLEEVDSLLVVPGGGQQAPQLLDEDSHHDIIALCQGEELDGIDVQALAVRLCVRVRVCVCVCGSKEKRRRKKKQRDTQRESVYLSICVWLCVLACSPANSTIALPSSGEK